jgi:hypothetical protein
MEKDADIQMQLFQNIRDQIPDHVSFVDVIAEILEISNDSAYRRIRGEKALSLYEVKKLCQRFNFSVDDLAGSSIQSVTFRTNLLNEQSYSFQEWFRYLLSNTINVGKSEQAEVIFILNELNIFHMIQFPEVCAFKLFFWQKSNLDFPKYRDKCFSVNELDDEFTRLAQEIIDHYVKINTIELITEECLNSYLKQIIYYYEAGYFNSRDDALKLCEQLLNLVDHQQRQAELGFKFPYGKHPVGDNGNFQLYQNEIILADNTILIKTKDTQIMFITTNAINIMLTHNKAFFEYNYNWGRNLLSKSILISGSAEKERNKFFLKLREQINRVADQL